MPAVDGRQRRPLRRQPGLPVCSGAFAQTTAAKRLTSEFSAGTSVGPLGLCGTVENVRNQRHCRQNDPYVDVRLQAPALPGAAIDATNPTERVTRFVTNRRSSVRSCAAETRPGGAHNGEATPIATGPNTARVSSLRRTLRFVSKEWSCLVTQVRANSGQVARLAIGARSAPARSGLMRFPIASVSGSFRAPCARSCSTAPSFPTTPAEVS